MRTIVNANTQANRYQGAQTAGGVDQSGQNRPYQKDLSNIRCFIYGKWGHYASFYDKQAHAGPVYASGALPANNMVLILEDYYCPPPIT